MKILGRKFIFGILFSLIGLMFYSLYIFKYSALQFEDSFIGQFKNSPFKLVNQLLAFSLFSLFGLAAYIVPFFALYLSIFVYKKQNAFKSLERILGFMLLISSTSLFMFSLNGFAFGGLTGLFLFKKLKFFMDPFLIKVCAFAAMWAASILVFRFSIMTPFKLLTLIINKKVVLFIFNVFKKVLNFVSWIIVEIFNWVKKCITGQIAKDIEEEIFNFEYQITKDDAGIYKDDFWHEYKEALPKEIKIEPEKLEKKILFVNSKKSVKENYNLPNLNIFTAVENKDLSKEFDKDLRHMATVLEEKLKRFGIEGKVISIEYGPVITLFHYEPSPDCKISKIVSLEDDLALALEATSIRIIAPIPGKSVVGFEISNRIRKDVLFSSIVHSVQFKNFEGYLPLVLGEDAVGHKVVVDLATMPHLLIAGSTGSGKSVALNAMLVSLLCKCSPEQLKLILIDPKRLEFSSYSDIAHLLFPIITQPRYAIGVLKWVVQEMESRYERMADAGARNLFDYNNFCKLNKIEELPFIVVIIDELADLMMTAGKDVEDQITRIAQMARASGIHMIVATQRPSVDVITGLIKVNFPSRISFRVSSRVDSKTILDGSGAEKLLGRGDMLFMDSRATRLQRVHGAYVSDEEINKIVSHVYAERKVEYLNLNDFMFTAKKDSFEEEDEIFNEIKTFLADIDEVSISLLQRRFRIGYNRSARIINQLESQGLILPADGGKLRKVIKRDE